MWCLSTILKVELPSSFRKTLAITESMLTSLAPTVVSSPWLLSLFLLERDGNVKEDGLSCYTVQIEGHLN